MLVKDAWVLLFNCRYILEYAISTQSCRSLHSLQSLSTPICQESWQNPFIKGQLDINQL